MPLKIKRIVSTNFCAEGNPLQSAMFNDNPVIPPFLVMNGAILYPVTAENLSGDWDVMVLNDGENLGLADNVALLSGVTEVLWLYHRIVAEVQREKLKGYFEKNIEFQPISFQHTPEYYDRYLYKVAALWKPGGEYGAKLAELDCALRAEQTESDIIDSLWLLAVQLLGTNDDELNNMVEEKLAVVEKWALTDNRCPSFTKLVGAVSSADNDDKKRVAYTKLKNALGNSLAGRDSVQDAISPA